MVQCEEINRAAKQAVLVSYKALRWDEVTKQMVLQWSPMTTGLKVTHRQERKEGGKDSRVKFNWAIISFGLFLLHPAFHPSFL